MKKLVKIHTDDDPNRELLFSELVESQNEFTGVEVEDVTTPAVADQEFVVRHGLGKKATRFEVLSRTKNGNLLKSSPEKWTAKVAFLKYSVASDVLTIRFR